MSLSIATVLCLSGLGQQPAQEVPEHAPRVALEVKNPQRVGRRVLHLDDVIGPGAREIGKHKPARAILIAGIPPALGEGPAPGGMDLAALAALHAEVKARGAMVIAVLITPPLQERRSARSEIDPETQPFVIAADPHGIARRLLGLTAPGRALVIRSDGRVIGAFGPEPGALAAAKALLLQQLEEVSP